MGVCGDYQRIVGVRPRGGTGPVNMWQFPKIRGPQYRPKNTIILFIGTPKKVPPILGNHHVSVFRGLKNPYAIHLDFGCP